MEWLSFLLLICTCFSAESLSMKSNCSSKGINIHHLASVTPYRFVRNDDTSFHYPGCTPVRAWLIVRHGTRYPSGKVLPKMIHSLPRIRDSILAAYKEGKGSLCSEEVAALGRWKSDIEEADEKRLTHEGEDEMVDLAERFQARFPQIFPDDYSNDTFKFQFTASQRTGESARYFTIGLFGKRVSRHVWFPEALPMDPILRFYKACPRWKRDVDSNPNTLKEKLKFKESTEMKESLEEIRTRLGLDTSLSYSDAYLMYVTCAFETAWYKKRQSPWCAAFSEKNLQVFEYAEDLEYYWIDGYGFNITHRQACPAFKDMMDFLLTGQTPRKKHSPRAVVYFTHSGALLKMLAHLGLYKDNQALRHDNYNLLGKTRKWRTSYIDAFGTNLAFILFRCAGESKVLTLHQERPVTLPGCPASSNLCPISTLLKTYNRSLSTCNFEEMCSLPQESGGR